MRIWQFEKLRRDSVNVVWICILFLNGDDSFNFDENAHGKGGDFDGGAGGLVRCEMGGVDGVDFGEIAHRLEKHGSLDNVREVLAARFYDRREILERLRLRRQRLVSDGIPLRRQYAPSAPQSRRERPSSWLDRVGCIQRGTQTSPSWLLVHLSEND